MNSFNEFHRTDYNSIQVDHREVSKNESKDHLYDVKEIISESNNSIYEQKNSHDDSNQIYQPIFHSSPCNLISDSGDIIDCPNNNYEKLQSSIKSQLSNDFLFKRDQSEDDGLVEPYPTPENSITTNEHQYFNFSHIVNDNEEKEQSTTIQYNFITEHPLTHVDSQHAILMERELEVIPNTRNAETASQSTDFNNEVQVIDKTDNEENFILPEKIDYKDLNPYEPSLIQSLVLNESQENKFNTVHYSAFAGIEYCTTSSYLLLPQLVQNHTESSNFFQQLWSPQVYSIESHTPENTLSILWSFLILLSKLFITGLYFLYSCAKFLRYDTLLFSFCYILGALFSTNAYFLIDFLLIVTCVISIFVASYEKWLFHYVGLTANINNMDELNTVENENQYWKRIKLAAYGLAIGTISTYIM